MGGRMTFRPPPPPRPVIVAIGWRANVGELWNRMCVRLARGPEGLVGEGDSSVRLAVGGRRFGGSDLDVARGIVESLGQGEVSEF